MTDKLEIYILIHFRIVKGSDDANEMTDEIAKAMEALSDVMKQKTLPTSHHHVALVTEESGSPRKMYSTKFSISYGDFKDWRRSSGGKSSKK